MLNNAKHHYDMVRERRSEHRDDLITQDIEMTSDVNHADIAFACNSWMEFTYPEMTVTVSNPWVQIWKGGIRPLYDTRNDARHLRRRRGEVDGNDGRRADPKDYFQFVYMNRVDVYAQRMLDASRTFYGYSADVMLKSEKGWMVMVRTYPRHPLWEETNESQAAVDAVGPVSRPTGSSRKPSNTARTSSSHREGPEATPYLPNAIFYDAIRTSGRMTTGFRSRRSTMTTSTCATSSCRGRKSSGTAIRCGRRGTSSTASRPKTRHRVHSQWSVNDWVQIYESNFGDPYRMDKRTPGVGEHQLHINPQAAKDRGINDGDYVYVDGNPVDRPYRGWKPSDPYYKVARLMIRAKYNPAYPYHVTMAKHAPYVSTAEVGEGPRDPAGRTRHRGGHRLSVQLPVRGPAVLYPELADADAPDRLACRASTRLPGSSSGAIQIDHHAVNTAPKECLIRITKAEDGGIGARGPMGTGPDRLYAGPGERVHDQVAQRRTHQDQGVRTSRAT